MMFRCARDHNKNMKRYEKVQQGRTMVYRYSIAPLHVAHTMYKIANGHQDCFNVNGNCPFGQNV